MGDEEPVQATLEDWILNITPKVSASISIPCSAFIIYEAISDHREGKGTAMLRALMGMSSVDIMASSAWCLSLWAVPKETGPLATGNTATCNLQGFILQLAIGAPLYNCSLALYYLLVIKYSWSNDHLRKIERYVHACIITFALSSSIAGLPLKMYNRFSYVCWSFGYPVDCGNSGTTSTDVPCERGDYAWLFGVVLFFVPLWSCIILTIIAMTLIYFHVRATMRRMRMYAFGRAQRGGNNSGRGSAASSGNTGEDKPKKLSLSRFRESVRASMRASLSGLRNSQNSESTTAQAQRRADQLSIFASQAVLYSLSFFLTWTPSTVWSIGRWFHMADFWLDFASSLCEPLQGFWNLLIFLRQRPSSKKKIRRFLGRICPCFKDRILEGVDKSEILRSSAVVNTEDSIRCNIDRMSTQQYYAFKAGSNPRLTANATSTDLSNLPRLSSAFGLDSTDDNISPFGRNYRDPTEKNTLGFDQSSSSLVNGTVLETVPDESPEQPPQSKVMLEKGDERLDALENHETGESDPANPLHQMESSNDSLSATGEEERPGSMDENPESLTIDERQPQGEDKSLQESKPNNDDDVESTDVVDTTETASSPLEGTSDNEENTKEEEQESEPVLKANTSGEAEKEVQKDSESIPLLS